MPSRSAAARTSKRNTEYRIGPEIAFGRSPVELKHRLIDTYLVGNLHSDNFRSNHIVYIGHGFQHAPYPGNAPCLRRAAPAPHVHPWRHRSEPQHGRKHRWPSSPRPLPWDFLGSRLSPLHVHLQSLTSLSYLKCYTTLNCLLPDGGGDNNRTASPNTQNYDIARY